MWCAIMAALDSMYLIFVPTIEMDANYLERTQKVYNLLNSAFGHALIYSCESRLPKARARFGQVYFLL
jgi:hypothetical protein